MTMIESASRFPRRVGWREWSLPSTRIVLGFESINPSWATSWAFAVAGGRVVVREHQPVLAHGLGLRRVGEPFVRLLDAAPNGEVAGHGPADQEQDEDSDRDRGDSARAEAPLALDGPRTAVLVRRSAGGGRGPLDLGPRLPGEGRDAAFGPASLVDAIGLVFRSHPAGYRTRRAVPPTGG